MKQYSIYKHVAAAIVVAVSCLALSSIPVSAESNAKGLELGFPSNSSMPYHYAPMYIYVKPGEKAIAEFTVALMHTTSAKKSGKFTLIGPDGDVVPGQIKTANANTHGMPGNTDGKPSTVLLESPAATEAGVYMVKVETGANASDPMDFRMNWKIGATKTSVNSIIPGRVWGDTYGVKNQLINSPANLSLFYVNEGGFHYKAGYHGLMGIDTTFASNKYGIVFKDTCQSAYHSLGDGRSGDPDFKLFQADSSSCGGQYKVFFAQPDPTLPQSVKLPDGKTTWLNNPIKPTSIVDMKFNSANDATTPLKGEITAATKNYTGNLELLVDVNGDGSFTDAVDRKILFANTTELTKYVFDGKDGQGNVIPEGVRVGFKIKANKKGEIHFTRADTEVSIGGLSIERLNGSPEKRTILYWNDSRLSTKRCGAWSIIPMNNQAGVEDSSAGVHGWTADGCKAPNGDNSHGNAGGSMTDAQYQKASSWGNNRIIEDWTFDGEMSYVSAVFYSAPLPEEPTPAVPNTGAAQLTANGTKALPWLLGAGVIAYYLRRRA